jgi:hypothetical protein
MEKHGKCKDGKKLKFINFEVHEIDFSLFDKTSKAIAASIEKSWISLVFIKTHTNQLLE